MASWPLPPAQRILLDRLAELIRRFGSYRFTTARLVGIGARDFPEAWDGTATAVGALLARLCWHAYLDVEIALDDQRTPAQPTTQVLANTALELVDVREGRLGYRISAIGNDDVAGFASHTIGAALLQLAPGEPFRGGAVEVAESEASLAAIYLGLGVLVANAAGYRRHTQRWEGQRIKTEEYIESSGGLSVDDAAFLLAVQDVVRDDLQEALAALHGPQRDRLEAWRDVLDDHEAELAELLELAAHAPVPIERGEPRFPAPLPEPDLRKHNRGRITFRVATRSGGAMLAGFVLGLTGGLWLPAPWLAAPAIAVAGTALGRLAARRRFQCSEPECGALMPTEVAECPGCGGTIAETIAHSNLRLDRRDELERGAGDGPTLD